jgi:thiol-disulfide isomerase/thioredoxin
MHLRFLFAGLILGFTALRIAPAQDAAAANPAGELQAIVASVQGKMKAGKGTAAGLAEELAAFEALRTKYRGQKTEEVADIHFMQATLYSQVLNDSDTAKKLLEQLKTDFPGTKAAASVDRALSSLERAAQAAQVKAKLVGQPAPALNFKWSSRTGLKTLADFKGKVVVLDFWATWCGPCVASFPQVRELTAHYKAADVEVVGVTSLQGYVMGLDPQRIDTKGDPAKEMALMKDYIKAKDLTWAVAFSEEPVFNPAYGVTGIPHMAIIAPDGTVRHTGLHPAMPHEQKVEMIDALLKEFGRQVPPATAKAL